MAEGQQDQGQQPSQSAATTATNTTTSGATPRSEPGPNNPEWVPRDRMSNVNRENAQLKERLATIEAEKEREAEDRARKQGEFKQLAEKHKKKAARLEDELKQVRSDWTRERRLNVWQQAASGVIKIEAISDAFDMLDDSDFGSVDDTDPVSVRRLAEQLADRKPYLSDGPRGAGSGGSRSPVLGAPESPNGKRRTTATGRTIFKGKSRPAWK